LSPEAIAHAIAAVAAPDTAWHDRARAHYDRLTMPPGSLGRLLDVGRQLAAVQRTLPPAGTPALVAVFAADHGVAAAGVSAYPPEVTGQMVANFLRGGAAVNVLTRRAGADVCVVDLGVAHPVAVIDPNPKVCLLEHAIARGTRNFLDEPAMTRAEAHAAVSVGLELGQRWAGREGYRVIALGDMGIGNSTTAAALIAALTGLPATAVVGRGTGVSDAGYQRKCAAVAQALAKHCPAPGGDALWDILARLGGFEILGLAGLAIGAAQHHALVVLDGLISSASGLIAVRLCPALRGSLLAAHLGPEPGHQVALDALGLAPLLDLGLRLGEGSGAALALPIVAAAADLLRDMATFDSAGVSGAVEHTLNI
jgi:nicotinate-nucleotide--dimethylbenzimidazole phosphoribosyltransferase